ITQRFVNDKIAACTGTKVGHAVACVVVPHHTDEGRDAIREGPVHGICVVVEEGSGTSAEFPSALTAKVHLLRDHRRLREDTGQGGEDCHKVSEESKEIEETTNGAEQTEHKHDDGCDEPQ